MREVARLADRIKSPSMRRAWVEILFAFIASELMRSPSMRRAWVEISSSTLKFFNGHVALHAEGVGRNSEMITITG